MLTQNWHLWTAIGVRSCFSNRRGYLDEDKDTAPQNCHALNPTLHTGNLNFIKKWSVLLGKKPLRFSTVFHFLPWKTEFTTSFFMQCFFEEFLELLPSSSPQWIKLEYFFFFLNLRQRRTFPQDMTRLGGKKIACIAVCSWQKGL